MSRNGTELRHYAGMLLGKENVTKVECTLVSAFNYMPMVGTATVTHKSEQDEFPRFLGTTPSTILVSVSGLWGLGEAWKVHGVLVGIVYILGRVRWKP